MRNLIKFLANNGIFLVFLGLEILCLNLVVRNNKRQSEIYHNTSSNITAGLQKQMSSVVNFWDLRSVNDSLRLENAQLRRQLLNRISSSSGQLPQDSAFQRFHVIPAVIIQNSITARNNYITLDQGASKGIHPGMAVITERGPIGIVVASTRRYSKVMSLLNSNSMISASIKSKGYFGSLVWRSANPKKMELDAIPKHANLQVGDTVVTSGYSNIFPQDIQIGTIDTFWLQRGSNFYRARVNLDVDISDLHNAYVIANYAVEELSELETTEIDEQ